MSDDEQLRLECLRLSLSLAMERAKNIGSTPIDPRKSAEEMYKYVKEGKTE